MSIPVLGAMVYNRGDLLVRMVESIDYPIEKLVILCNGVDQSVADGNERIRALFPDVIIHNPGFNQPKPVNLGFSGGWNWFLKNYLEDWVLVVGNDFQFMPGQLKLIAEYYQRHKGDSPPMGVVNTNWGWNCHGITKDGLKAMGYMDENAYPCFYDDTDMDYRHTLARRLGLLSYPAEGECVIKAHHEGSATSRALSPAKAEKMAKAFERNMEYYIRKWGGPQCQEKFDHPFNNPNLSIRDWTLEPGRWELNSLD